MSWNRGTDEDRIEAEREGWSKTNRPRTQRSFGSGNQESMGWLSWVIGFGLLILGGWGAWALFNHFNAGQ